MITLLVTILLGIVVPSAGIIIGYLLKFPTTQSQNNHLEGKGNARNDTKETKQNLYGISRINQKSIPIRIGGNILLGISEDKKEYYRWISLTNAENCSENLLLSNSLRESDQRTKSFIFGELYIRDIEFREIIRV